MKSSKYKIFIIVTIIIFIIILITSIILILTPSNNFLRTFWDDIILDNKVNYLSCDKFPSEDLVNQTLELHKDIIKEIKTIDNVSVETIDTDFNGNKCNRKEILLFSYIGHSDRVRIVNIINSDTFFGIPYDLRNY